MHQAAGPAAEPSAESPPAAVTPDQKSWVEIALADEAGNPVLNEQYQIVLPDGSTVNGTLDVDGQARVDGIDPGTCTITFPNLDTEAWHRK